MTWERQPGPAGGRHERDEIVLLAMTVGSEQDVFTLRRQAKTAAVAAGLERHDQVRLATALSELGRDLLRPAPMTATFLLDPRPWSVLRVEFRWTDSRAPGRESLDAVTRLLPRTTYEPGSGADGTAGGGPGGRVVVACPLPRSVDGVEPARQAEGIRARLRADGPTSAIDDLRAQTQDLLAALEESRAQRDELEQLNQELQETNQGVMALYAELSQELDETNRGVVALYSEEHQLALTLQRTFLPDTLPTAAGVNLAVRYLPAASQTEIGGDFYEAVDTPTGLLLAVGDVVGHSLQAAIVMGELRHALRAYTAEGHPPHVLLERLDGLMDRHQPGWTATVCIILIEPGNDRFTVANAGHIPPLLMPADGEASYIHEHGPMLGLKLPQPCGTVHKLAPGDRILLFTDGLVETRGTDLRERMAELRGVAVGAPDAPDRLCDTLVNTFSGQQEDDIVVFVAHVDGKEVTG
ncbi:PP2C family protein-serine/threonine phosphatase [Streptomyces sp. NBC_01198]|uniref:PP2C family protein-serine/threonine phosphatase n=1 Tax=Streptomyces sp. NBC_01198 TaxID=2903769 RepID=UPI002E12B6D0|nr:SpoIIE family protein phosphatase [Streptomyces sp. NBC_01198]